MEKYRTKYVCNLRECMDGYFINRESTVKQLVQQGRGNYCEFEREDN